LFAWKKIGEHYRPSIFQREETFAEICCLKKLEPPYKAENRYVVELSDGSEAGQTKAWFVTDLWI